MIINLQNTVFEFTPEIVNNLPSNFCWFKGKPTPFSDFGIVILTPENCEIPNWVLKQNDSRELIFFGSLNWKLAHVVHAFGIFNSIGQARKNGWDKDIEFGLTQHMVRINKVRGSFQVWKWGHENLDWNLQEKLGLDLII
jgi:hypothetical protein